MVHYFRANPALRLLRELFSLQSQNSILSADLAGAVACGIGVYEWQEVEDFVALRLDEDERAARSQPGGDRGQARIERLGPILATEQVGREDDVHALVRTRQRIALEQEHGPANLERRLIDTLQTQATLLDQLKQSDNNR